MIDLYVGLYDGRPRSLYLLPYDGLYVHPYDGLCVGLYVGQQIGASSRAESWGYEVEES